MGFARKLSIDEGQYQSFARTPAIKIRSGWCMNIPEMTGGDVR